eukprot:gene10850-19669_t
MEVTKQATIGPDSWKVASVRNIRLAQTVVQRSDKFNDLGRQLDPLPSLRDSCIQQSNAQIHSYVRETRSVVVKLKYCLLETEEEIKSLLRGKENLEKTHEHIRKDILLNNNSHMRRQARPVRERKLDGADDLLAVEKEQLLKLKRILESKLRSVQKQLQALDNARKRIKAIISERSRVLDLICHSVSSAIPATTSSDSISVGKRSTVRYAPMETDPLGPCTPEVTEVMSLAADARKRSVTLRKEVTETIDQIQKLQKAAHRSVNDGLTKKVSETTTMKQHLQMTSGEIRMARHRGERWHYATDVARGYTLGPVTSKDLETRERLDRPTVSTFQRHPGTQLPEAQEIIEGNNGLKESLDAIGRNIALLKLTQNRLKEDISDKNNGAQVDSSVVRLRRRKYDHRWVISGIEC